MIQAILNWLAMIGRRGTNVIGSRGDYIRPQRGDTAADATALAGDFARVGMDLRAVIDQELARRGG